MPSSRGISFQYKLPLKMPALTNPFQLAVAAAVASAATYVVTRQFSPEAQLARMMIALTDFLRTEHQAQTATCFTIDRILDADCKGKTLTIGVHSKGDPNLPLSHQGIRHGQHEPIKRLLEFKKAPDGKELNYLFENDIRLSVTKAEKGGVRYSFQTPQVSVAKAMDPILVMGLKGIDMNSAELDEIVKMR